MYRYRIQNLTMVGSNTCLLTLRPKRRKDRFSFHPGQYAALGFWQHGRPSVVRCFSIVSSPGKPDQLQFALRVVGDFTQALANLHVGDEVFVHAPFGEFVIDDRYDQNVVLLAGGIGITPFMSMVRSRTERQSRLPITLLYSAQSQEDLPFYEELLALEQQNPYLRAAFFITRGGTENLSQGQVLNGRIDTDYIGRLVHRQPQQTTYFICGPKRFMQAMQTALLEQGVASERIVSEDFSTAPPATTLLSTPNILAWWTYGLTGASLALGTLAVMALDVVSVVPKAVSAQAVHQVQIPAPTPSPNASPSDTTSTDTAAPAPVSDTPAPATQDQTVIQPSQEGYYRRPMTSVS